MQIQFRTPIYNSRGGVTVEFQLKASISEISSHIPQNLMYIRKSSDINGLNEIMGEILLVKKRSFMLD